ncbi:MAG: hypothetical protein KAY24_08945 [Candidatus Eisenbacteria sp.]|nr:hypothetical protein [Candidatus Eisenbacteria bacterium]
MCSPRMKLCRLGIQVFILAVLSSLAVSACSAYWEGMNALAPEESGQSLYAIRTPNLFYHNVGQLEVMVTNVGVIGNPGWADSFGAGWKGGEFLYCAALWFGAVASDNLAYVSTGAYETELLPSLDPIDTIYTTFEGATGGDRAGFSTSGGDDDGDGEIDEDPLNGKDDDGDGQIDEDYAAISQQMFSCEYWDDSERAIEIYPRHRPLHIKITQNSFAWSTEGADEFVGFEYDILNNGFETLREIYIGYFVDSDAGRKDAPGYWSDDGGAFISIDTTYIDRTITYECDDRNGEHRICAEQDLHIDIAYMRDTPGSVTGGNAADDLTPLDGYFGGMFLGHTTDPLGERAPERVEISSLRFFSGSGTYPDGDPRNDFERYDLISSHELPKRPTGQPADYRYCFSGGPFKELLPGESLNFQVAFVIGNGEEGLVANAIMAQRVYNGAWRDTDGLKDTGCGGRETCLRIPVGSDPLEWHDPCDSIAPPVVVKNTECNPDGNYPGWVDNDCNCCTPLQATADKCDGLETLIHWVGTVAPPPPTTSTEDPSKRARVEKDHRIVIEWNNSSELVADPISGEIRFCGYRVWRVEGWTRPIGSTGPTPEEWQLIADLSVNNERKQPEGTELLLDDYMNPYVAIVDTLPHPVIEDSLLYEYDIGRYRYVDTMGLKNGMIYFYDVTAYSCWQDTLDSGQIMWRELASQPAAVELEGVRPLWGAVTDGSWKDSVMVVPNPWRRSADWDLTPSDRDPTGTHIDFARLPNCECTLRIYTIAGDLVQTLHHDGSRGRGTIEWNMISRNGQDIASGVYLYAVTCGDETFVDRFTVIR